MKRKLLNLSLVLAPMLSSAIDIKALQNRAIEMQKQYERQYEGANGDNKPLVIDNNSNSLPMPQIQSQQPQQDRVVKRVGEEAKPDNYISVSQQIKETNQQSINTPNPSVPKRKGIRANDTIPTDAKRIALDSVIKVGIVKNAFITFKFPFKISEVQQSSDFNMRQTTDNASLEGMDNGILDYGIDGNKFFLKSIIAGKVSFTIFGGSYPVTLNVYVNERTGASYVLIEDKAKIKSAEIRELKKEVKGLPLETRITNLITSLYKDKRLVGYEEVQQRKVFYNKAVKLTFIHDKDFYSPYLLGEKWSIINQGKKPVQIYEEMFDVSQDIIAVSIENDVIEPQKSSSVFVIKYGSGMR